MNKKILKMIKKDNYLDLNDLVLKLFKKLKFCIIQCMNNG